MQSLHEIATAYDRGKLLQISLHRFRGLFSEKRRETIGPGLVVSRPWNKLRLLRSGNNLWNALVGLARSRLRPEQIRERMLNVDYSPRVLFSRNNSDLDGKHQRRPLGYGH
jgi:hypothetical protein